jgi:hypothetical protein
MGLQWPPAAASARTWPRASVSGSGGTAARAAPATRGLEQWSPRTTVGDEEGLVVGETHPGEHAPDGLLPLPLGEVLSGVEAQTERRPHAA